MTIWSSEIKELEKLYQSFKGQLPDLEKELEPLINTIDPIVVMVYSRRSLEVIITELCEKELKRPRKTQPLKGIIDLLNSEEKVPPHIINSMLNLNSSSSFGAHPKDFEPEQVKPVLNNLTTIIKWYLKYKNINQNGSIQKTREENPEILTRNERIKTNKRKILLISAILFSVALFFSLTWLVFSQNFRKENDKEITEKSIAILPFKLLSNEPDKQYLADGMMDAILLHLSKIKDLRVMSRTSVEQYRDTKKTIHSIGNELDVAYVLEGSFQKEGDKVRLIVQLIKAGEESHVWSNDYDRNWKDIFTVQSEVAQTIADELHTFIAPDVKQSIERTPTSNLTAYDFYQRGQEEYLNYWMDNTNLKALERAEKFYQRALEYDSSFALAYSGLAKAYLDKKNTSAKAYFTSNFIDSTLIMANTALKYDDKLAEAYYAKGLYYWWTGKTDQVMVELDKALKYNPNNWEVYYFKGTMVYLYDLDDIDYVKAIENLNKAISLNHGRYLPELLRTIGSIYGSHAGIYEKEKYYFQEALKLEGDSARYLRELGTQEFGQSKYLKAIEYYEKANLLDSDNMNFIHFIGTCYIISGQYKEALKWYKKYANWLIGSGKIQGGRLHRIGYAYWINGYKKEGKYWFDLQKRYSEETIHNKRVSGLGLTAYYDLAGIYAFMGEKEKAYENLNILQQVSVFPKWWVTLIKDDPLFESIRKEQQFQKIVKDMEAKYEAEHERVRKWMEKQG